MFENFEWIEGVPVLQDAAGWICGGLFYTLTTCLYPWLSMLSPLLTPDPGTKSPTPRNWCQPKPAPVNVAVMQCHQPHQIVNVLFSWRLRRASPYDRHQILSWLLRVGKVWDISGFPGMFSHFDFWCLLPHKYSPPNDLQTHLQPPHTLSMPLSSMVFHVTILLWLWVKQWGEDDCQISQQQQAHLLIPFGPAHPIKWSVIFVLDQTSSKICLPVGYRWIFISDFRVRINMHMVWQFYGLIGRKSCTFHSSAAYLLLLSLII